MYSRFPAGYLFKSSVAVISVGCGASCAYEFLKGGEQFHSNLLLPVIHRLFDAERAHKLGVWAAKHRVFPRWGASHASYERLRTEVFGLTFDNPIGLAAGFDKDAEAVDGLRKSGFGFVEVGTVTPLPQPGNERPRVFRLAADAALVNRYGFNSAGHGVVMRNLGASRHPAATVPLGVNIGCNKTTDDRVLNYTIGMTHMGGLCDYVAVNVSSPNTPDLRRLQHKRQLRHLLREINDSRARLAGRKPKLLVKVAPDLSDGEKKDIADVCLEKALGVDGLIVCNTTVQRPDGLASPQASESGGLSGAPLLPTSTRCVADFYRLTGGALPIVGVGGVSDGRDAYSMVRAGASLVQLYTALVYHGFPVVGKVKRQLDDCLRKDGFDSIADAVGADHKISKQL